MSNKSWLHSKARKLVRDNEKREMRAVSRKVATQTLLRYSEIKYHNTQYTGGIDNNGIIYDLSAVGQGDTDITRDGDRMMPTSLDVAFMVNGEANSGISRLIIFRWFNNDTPTPSLILNTVGSSYSTVSPYYHDYKDKFNILLDRSFIVSNNGKEIAQFKKRLVLAKTKQIQFVAGSTAGTNKIFALVIGDGILAGTPDTYLYSQMKYRDF